SQAAVFSTCQMPCRLGLLSDVRGVAGPCAATRVAGKQRNAASTTLADPYRIREPPWCSDANSSTGVARRRGGESEFVFRRFSSGKEGSRGRFGAERAGRPCGQDISRFQGAEKLLLLARTFALPAVSQHWRLSPLGKSPGSIGRQLVLNAPC